MDMGVVRLRPAGDGDEGFIYDVFCTTWEDEVASLPNPALAQHVLRIQYTAQERRFHHRYPGFVRYIVMLDDEPIGRMYLLHTERTIHLIDTTLLPEHRGQGLGTHLAERVLEEAAAAGKTVNLRCARRNHRALALYASLDFKLQTMDDLDCHLEWRPEEAQAEPVPDSAG
jgi:GNAT superfamily N-acetyltransferase